uniref:Uncharacterized protein AlNc14C4G595 n=1 Tax=Albugo laibachii Nc14 TaxID=890382 RepID=F0W0F2_9STRA|nr:conserved hypothetical protein [Albugo laibachii Nc14]|eukprot:CCA14524.1 conserved hypothetical protein [Albugo laibachii Nc14]
MVFVSLKSFLDGPYGHTCSSLSRAICLEKLGTNAVSIMVTPATLSTSKCPGNHAVFSTYNRRKSGSPSINVHSERRFSLPMKPQTQEDTVIVMYLMDHMFGHKWILRKSFCDYQQFRKDVGTIMSDCHAFQCCGPLRRTVKSTMYKHSRRSSWQSKLTYSITHSNIMEEFLSDLLVALDRDCQCDNTIRSRTLLFAFLNITTQRQKNARKLLDNFYRPDIEKELESHIACRICLDPLTCTKNPIQLPCQHIFHHECIYHWLLSAPSCPVCRCVLTQSNSS